MGSKQITSITTFVQKIGLVKLAIIFVCFVVAVAGGITYYRRQQPGYTIQKYDKETGETLSLQPNNDPEKTDGQPSATVLGTSSLYKMGAEGLSLNQVALLNNDLGNTAIKSLVPHDPVIKVVKPRYDRSTYTLSAELIYKKGMSPAAIVFSLDSVDSFNYKLLVQNKVVYQSGQLIVGDPNYSGDGAPPEEQ